MPFYFRINRLKIIDNKESGFLFFRKDLAEIRITSMMVTRDSMFPPVETYRQLPQIKANDLQVKRDLATSIINQILNQSSKLNIDEVRDNQTLTFGDTGYVIHKSENIPEDLNWLLLALEDDQDIRNLGEHLLKIIETKQFDAFAAGLAQLAGTANPGFAIGIAAIKFLAGLIAKELRINPDDLAGMLYMSLNRQEHYPHGERKADAVPDLTGNMLVDYSLFGYEEIPPRMVPRRLPV